MKLVMDFEVLDFFASDLFDDDDFFDASHLNRKGAAKFTKLLNSMIAPIAA